jgi:hypothetical protein
MEVAIEESRIATREAHEAVKDLRQATKEARMILDEGATKIIGRKVEEGLSEYRETLDIAIKEASDAVFRRFDTIKSILLGEDGSGPSIESLLRKRQGEVDV